MIQSLLDGKAPSQATSGSTSSDSTALKKKIIKKIEGNTMTLTGPTFHFKEELKKMGAKFNGETKAWVITKKDNDNFDEVLHFFADKDDDTEAAMKRPAKRRRM